MARTIALALTIAAIVVAACSSDDTAENSGKTTGGYGGLYAINGSTDQLYTIDRDTGAATVLVDITGVSFGPVGIELHPSTGIIYACTDDAVLYRVDPTAGQATAIGSGMGHVAVCNNLAAPWSVIPCLDPLSERAATIGKRARAGGGAKLSRLLLPQNGQEPLSEPAQPTRQNGRRWQPCR